MPSHQLSRTSSRQPREIFLSHSSRDRRFARRLAVQLRKVSIGAWYSEVHIKGATQWQDEIGEALNRCDWFVLILTPDSIKSKWVRRELQYALNSSKYDNRIIPLVFKKCDRLRISWTLGGFQHVDFTKSFDVGWKKLIRIWTPVKGLLSR